MYLKFQVGDTHDVEFHKYNTGKKIEGEYQGQPTVQYLYGVRVNGEETSWYTTPNTNQILQENNLQVGDIITVARVAEKQYVFTRNGKILMKANDSEVNKVVAEHNANKTISGKELLDRIKSLELKVSVLEGRLSQSEPKSPLEAQNEPNKELTVEEVEQAFGEDSTDVSKIPF